MGIEFKLFYVGVVEENEKMFLDELEKLCKKYADDDYLFRWEGVETPVKAEADSELSRG